MVVKLLNKRYLWKIAYKIQIYAPRKSKLLFFPKNNQKKHTTKLLILTKTYPATCQMPSDTCHLQSRPLLDVFRAVCNLAILLFLQLEVRVPALGYKTLVLQ